MDATEPQSGRAPLPGPTEPTAELLRQLSACATDSAAIQLALQRAAEAVDADLCVYVDGDLLESASSESTLTVPVNGRLRGHLVLARAAHDFDHGERESIHSIARALSLFEPGIGPDELLDRLATQDELAAALGTDQIQAYFLPKADLATVRVSGVEALARWFHPERGILPPADFLALAESGGLLPALTERIIDLATRAAGDWWRSGLQLEISVNLPASALAGLDPHLLNAIPAALDRTGVPAGALRFEVAEDAVMSAADPTPALGALTDLGAKISIDDFGTGHTSLERLEQLGVDELKIDRALIRALARGADRALVRSTIHLARQLGLRIVAEGVDSGDAWRQLRGMGCDAAQGFLIGAPMPAREFLAWIASWDARGRKLNTMPREPQSGRSRRETGSSSISPAEDPRIKSRSPDRRRRVAARGRDLMTKP
ncbi:MAG TPA: EAL domain-containing protein [Solirubrobacterales bacterium]|jgi:EAL domain-containing protein (putative c-di-GMP-specific phosphodiesterase class I)|nr:EAL domain-containing protein [Solirubrobacterales bacterium]